MHELHEVRVPPGVLVTAAAGDRRACANVACVCTTGRRHISTSKASSGSTIVATSNSAQISAPSPRYSLCVAWGYGDACRRRLRGTLDGLHLTLRRLAWSATLMRPLLLCAGKRTNQRLHALHQELARVLALFLAAHAAAHAALEVARGGRGRFRREVGARRGSSLADGPGRGNFGPSRPGRLC